MRTFSVFLLLFVCCQCFSQSVTGDWHGTLTVMNNRLPLVFHFNDGKEELAQMESPNQSSKALPVRMQKNRGDTIALEMPTIGAAYEGVLRDGTVIGKFTQMGMSFFLSLTPGAIERRRPQTPKPPFPYKEEELTFTNPKDSASLAGTLVTPADAADAPLVVFVSGSGQQDRDEEMFGHRPFAVIADHLARNGIASFRYDDRGKGKSIGLLTELTTESNRQDALRAIRMLRAKGVAKNIGIIGHSEGGLIAFMIAGEQPKEVDFIVPLAGPAVNGEEIVSHQIAKLTEHTGKNPDGKDYSKDLDSLINLTLEAKRQIPWYKFYFEYDPAPVIAKVQCPVFALFGSKDVQVLAKENSEALRSALKVKPQDKIKVYEGLNHLFQHADTGMMTEYGSIEETISEEVLTDIVKWIKSLSH